MISVRFDARDFHLVTELFRLLNAEWIRYESGCGADVVIDFSSKAILDKEIPAIKYLRLSESKCANHNNDQRKSVVFVKFNQIKLPLYCGYQIITDATDSFIETTNGEALSNIVDNDGIRTVTIGYDLLAEIDHLLNIGQPEECASIATLDFHLEILKQALIKSAHIDVIKKPIKKILVLSHDIDSPFLKPYLFSSPVAGILIKGIKGVLSHSEIAQHNKRILVHSMKHFFSRASDPLEGLTTCVETEKKLEVKSTYFVVSRFNTRGKKSPAETSNINYRLMRTVKYGKNGLQRIIGLLSQAQSEIALHGLDAWYSADDAAEEKRMLEQHGVCINGNRSHWLYWDTSSPKFLADAGFIYDSTRGYNSTIGFKCGTAKPFHFPGVPNIWELPMIIMDIALIDHKFTDQEVIIERVMPIMNHISQYGGVLTINWHDRSFSQERPWKVYYFELIKKVLENGFTPMNANEAVETYYQ